MESYQKQIMQAKDRFLKKQINFILFGILFFIILFSKISIGEEIKYKVANYVKNLNLLYSFQL